MKIPEMRTPFARAVVPVAAGIGFFVVLGVVLWGIAAYLADKGPQVNLGRSEFTVGRVDQVSDAISKNGPLLFQGLKGDQADRSLIVDHSGVNDLQGWAVYQAIPTDKPDTCFVSQQPKTRIFTDCDGRVVSVEQLRLATGVIISFPNQQYLALTLPSASVSTPLSISTVSTTTSPVTSSA